MIRKATLEDLSRLLEIESECFSSPWPREAFVYELTENPVSEVWLLENEGIIIGYYDLWISFEQADLANIAVAEDYQGQGYGDQLMQHLQKQARQAGCEVLALEVRVNNEKAINLYRKHGFTIVSTRENYYRENGGYIDGYRMMKGV